jgi:hypothetical protein
MLGVLTALAPLAVIAWGEIADGRLGRAMTAGGVVPIVGPQRGALCTPSPRGFPAVMRHKP